jgi:threonine/homoserine/homoserine lactone efflux protein
MSVATFFTSKKLQNKLTNYRFWLEKVGGVLLVGFGCKLLWLK